MGDSKLKSHQEKALKQVENGNFCWKISDMGSRNPFDAICLLDADAIVCRVYGKDVKCSVNNDKIIYSFRI